MTYAETTSHAYFVTLRRDSRTAFLLGPYVTRREAEANVERARAEAVRLDSWAGFDGVGVARVTLKPGAAAPRGRLNARIGLSCPAPAQTTGRASDG